MKKNLGLTLLLGLFCLTGSAWAQIDCYSRRNCQYVDDTTGAYQPAVSFQMAQDGTVHIKADVYRTLTCFPGTSLITVEGDLNLPAGPNIVYINFDPPLEPGTELGIRWEARPCESSIWFIGCVGYTLGVEPDVCTAGGAEAATVSVLDVLNPVQ